MIRLSVTDYVMACFYGPWCISIIWFISYPSSLR